MKKREKEIVIILDTNSLIYSIKNKVDIRDRIIAATSANRIVVPECVIRELEGLSASNYHAKAALLLSERFEKIESEGRGDDCIIKCAESVGGTVLTNDRELSSRLKAKGLGTMLIRRGAVVDSS